MRRDELKSRQDAEKDRKMAEMTKSKDSGEDDGTGVGFDPLTI